MQFSIADTFNASLARLTDDEQKAVETTAFDLQVDPAGNSMSFHKLDKTTDPNFYSVRVSRDIRLILHKTAGSLLSCYVDHHDKAYQWAERRKLEVHPTTGAAQIVEIRERVEEILVPKYVEGGRPATQQKLKLFAKYGDAQLLAYGVPHEWLANVKAADEDSLLELVDHLPGEAAEALLELATRRHAGVAGSGWQGGGPIPAPGRATPLPRHVRYGRAGPRPGIPVGQVDGIPPSGAASAGRAPLQRCGACVWLGGH